MSSTPLYPIETRYAFNYELKVDKPVASGAFGHDQRRIINVRSGTISGPDFEGQLEEGGSDWITLLPDGTIIQDVRLCFRLSDGHTALITAYGIRRADPAVLARLDAGEAVSRSEYYFRTQPQLATSAPHLNELTRSILIGTGERTQEGVRYAVYQVI